MRASSLDSMLWGSMIDVYIPVTEELNLTSSFNGRSGECSKDRVGSMIGFYIIRGRKLTAKAGLIIHNGEAWDSSPFSMSHSVSTPPGFTLNFSGPEEVSRSVSFGISA